ncbi:hypothetical protein FQZ97_1095300 [compost metagenome]
MPCELRSSSFDPVAASKSDSRRLAAESARWQASAPLVMLPDCATAQNRRSVTKSTRAGLMGAAMLAF